MKHFSLPARQRGVAVITALLLTALAITVVASLFWQQQVQVRSMENQRLRLQTQWAMRGMVDFARFWLRQDNPSQTALDGVWATPIEEARLDDYVDREKVDTEKFDATVSGRALDAQARFNITNLAAATGIVSQSYVQAYQRLLANLQLDSSLAQATADAVLRAKPKPRAMDSGRDGKTPAASPPSGGSSEPVAFTQVEDLLAVPGYTPQIIEKLRDFIIVLPEITSVNVNTAPAEVLAAVTMMSLSEASALTLSNPRKKFVDLANFKNNINAKPVDGVELDVKSRYFLTVIRVRLDRAALDAVALVNRKTDPQRTTSLVWLREN
ncbi:type II secretion system minor pseudopilin GspK [Janthinobacterium tructae]|uniref:type II secretion system minor pseudopilin GspK n=1 Tax=Janthinobacterium tructae TaxID=2590869 RepID=UPI00249A7BFE|nr:type II secretion system minor pseudopilin GspK [Janthinobacterium tructae]MDI3296179.1 type II secretion system minor pseudopilin GspK [Janthinobacterium tructae]